MWVRRDEYAPATPATPAAMQYRRLFCCCCCCSSSSSSSTSHRHRGGRLESRGSRTPLTYEEEEQNDAAGGGGAERVGGDGESGSGDVCGWLWFLVTLEWLDAGDRPNARRGGDDDRGTEDFFRREASMREGGAGVRRGDAGAVGGSRGSGRTMSADDAKPLLVSLPLSTFPGSEEGGSRRVRRKETRFVSQSFANHLGSFLVLERGSRETFRTPEFREPILWSIFGYGEGFVRGKRFLSQSFAIQFFDHL